MYDEFNIVHERNLYRMEEIHQYMIDFVDEVIDGGVKQYVSFDVRQKNSNMTCNYLYSEDMVY